MKLLFLYLYLFSAYVIASPYDEPLTFDSEQVSYTHGGKIKYIADESETLTIDSILKLDQVEWNEHPDKAVNFGFDDTPYWYKLDLDNRTTWQEWLFYFSQASIDYIDFYVVKDEKVMQHYIAGDHRSINERPIKHPYFIFPASINHEENQTVYFKVQSPIQQLGLEVWEKNAFEEKDFNYRFILSIFFGVLFVLAVSNFVLFFTERDVAFLFFVFYLVSLAGFQFSKTGLHSYFALTPQWTLTYYQYFFAVALVVMFTLFLRAFAETKKYYPRFDLALRILIVLFICSYFLRFIYSLELSLKLSFMLAMGIMIIIVILSFYIWKRATSSKIMIVAWISFAVAASLLGFSKLGLLPRNFLTEHSFYFGIVIETILISLALGYKIKEQRQQFITYQSEENVRLEGLVKARTAELEQVNAHLQTEIAREVAVRINAIEEQQKQESLMLQQSKIAKIGEMLGAITHQWMQPLSVISIEAECIPKILEKKSIDYESLNEISEVIQERVSFMSETLTDFKHFYKQKKQNELFSVFEAVESITRMFGDNFSKSQISIALELHENFHCYGYSDIFQHAILNIFNNAKDAIQQYQVKDGLIKCSFYNKSGKGIITIEDNGGGIKESLLPDAIFESQVSTKGEGGMGIGLQITKMIIEEKMHGNITAANRENGALFTITLPIAKSLS